MMNSFQSTLTHFMYLSNWQSCTDINNIGMKTGKFWLNNLFQQPPISAECSAPFSEIRAEVSWSVGLRV